MEARDRLWNEAVVTTRYAGDLHAYLTAVLEQYKVYVEMADRISQRRGLANTFYLTINAVIFTLIEVLLRDRPQGPVWWLLSPLVVLIGQCFAWYYSVAVNCHCLPLLNRE